MDDIVERLRNACAHLCDKCNRENSYGVGDEAAAEIERLRAALRSAAGKLSAFPPYTDWRLLVEQFYRKHLNEEARRG